MSAFVVSKAHIDALVTAGLDLGRHGYLYWYWPELTAEQESDAYARGSYAGSGAPEVAEARHHELWIDTADQVGAMLWAENYRSVNHRYAEDNQPQAYGYTRCRRRLSAVALLKAVNCYEYQSCEHPGWKRSQAYAFCQALRSALIRELPGYEQAPWHIDG